MRTFIISIFCLITFLGHANKPTAATFFKGSIEEARVKASTEGKLFLVDFYADWCTPCNWMKETTYSDSTVMDIIARDYVAFKVNIDEVEGYQLKERYSIRYLPTILVFNSQSQLLLRIEETLSPSQMVKALEKYNTTENKRVFRHEVNRSPADTAMTLNQQLEIEEDTNEILLIGINPTNSNQDRSQTIELKTEIPDTLESKVTELTEESGIQENDSEKKKIEKSIEPLTEESKSILEQQSTHPESQVENNSADSSKAATEKVESSNIDPTQDPQSSETENSEPKEQALTADANGKGALGNFEYTKKVKPKYRLQIGVYSNFKNTYTIVNDLKRKFDDPVIVLNDNIDGKKIYRVFLGAFYTKEEAEEFQRMLNTKHQIKSVIK